MASSEFDKAKGSSLEKNLSLETHLRKRAEVLDTLVPNKKRMPQASWLDSVPVSGDPLGENAFSQGHMDDRSPDFERIGGSKASEKHVRFYAALFRCGHSLRWHFRSRLTLCDLILL